MHSIQLIEPTWGINILEWGISLQEKYTWISNFAPIFADAFVIIYPIFLVVIYVYAIIKKNKTIKQGALYIFFATLISVLINIGIQCFFYKERPIAFFNQLDTSDTLLHDILPVSSFPSDHAVVSMSFAMATLIWGIYSRKKFYKWSGAVLLVVSFVMTSCRVLTLVHWPSDIVAGIALGILIPALLFIKPIKHALIKFVIDPLIKLEEWVVKKYLNMNSNHDGSSDRI